MKCDETSCKQAATNWIARNVLVAPGEYMGAVCCLCDKHLEMVKGMPDQVVCWIQPVGSGPVMLGSEVVAAT